MIGYIPRIGRKSLRRPMCCWRQETKRLRFFVSTQRTGHSREWPLICCTSCNLCSPCSTAGAVIVVYAVHLPRLVMIRETAFPLVPAGRQRRTASSIGSACSASSCHSATSEFAPPFIPDFAGTKPSHDYLHYRLWLSTAWAIRRLGPSAGFLTATWPRRWGRRCC